MKPRIITKKLLEEITCDTYGAGNKLKIKDKIYSGCTINYSNINGVLPSTHNPNDISLSLKLFVEKDNILYELYKAQ